MNITEEMLAYKPKLRDGFILYKRKENNSESIIKFATNDGKFKIVNESFIKIVELFNGNNTIEYMVNTLSNYYNVEKQILINDVLETVCKIISFNGLDIKEKCPFLKTIKVNTKNNYQVYLSDVSSQRELETFMNKTGIFSTNKNTQFITYVNPITDYYGFAYKKSLRNFFITLIKKNDKICGFVGISDDPSIVKVVEYIAIDKDYIKDIDEIITSSLMILSKVTKNGNEQYFRTHVSDDTNSLLSNYFIHSSKFKSILLENELGVNRSVHECDYCINR